MNSSSCMLSLIVCLVSPAAVSNQCVLVLIASRLSGWWPPTWFITAIVLQLKLLPNPQTRPCTRSWPPSKTDRVSPSVEASSYIMLKLTSVSGLNRKRCKCLLFVHCRFAEIQKLVLSGRMGEAIETTQQLYPNLLERNPDLLFMLK